MTFQRQCTCLIAAASLGLGLCRAANAADFGTGFTYQGLLTNNGEPLSASIMDVRFRLLDGDTLVQVPGSAASVALDVPMIDGVFTATVNAAGEFGPNAFDGTSRKLEVAIDPNGNGNWIPLSPPQDIRATPYTHYAGDGAGGGLWQESGADVYYDQGSVGVGTSNITNEQLAVTGRTRVYNSSETISVQTWVGTSGAVIDAENGHLQLRTNGTDRVFISSSGDVGIGTASPGRELEVAGTLAANPPNAPNGSQIILGSPANDVGVVLRQGDGAGSQLYRWDIAVATDNSALEIRDDIVDADRLVIDTAGNVGIGASSPQSILHVRTDDLAVPSAALENEEIIVEGQDAVIGLYSEAQGNWGSAIALKEVDAGALVDTWGIARRTATATVPSSLRFTYGTSDNYANNPGALELRPFSRVVPTGKTPDETLTGVNVLAGAANNTASSSLIGVVLLGGNDSDGTILNYNNQVTGDWGTVSGGGANSAGSFASVGGGFSNSATGQDASVGGGNSNSASGDHSHIGGGRGNTASDIYATVSGGNNCSASARAASVGGGNSNDAAADYATVCGGATNDATGSYSAVLGGVNHTASGQYSAVAGGFQNVASGQAATVSGYGNGAYGDYSFAAGRSAYADHEGAFVFSGSSVGTLHSTAPNQFCVRASGGVYLFSNAARTTGVRLLPGLGSWASVSDRSAKTNFAEVNGRTVLERLAEVPISTWKYKAEEGEVQHMGPMAQDFHAAFGLGSDNRHIVTVDADGVALAAIQGLHELVLEKEEQIEAVSARVAEQQQLLDALIKRVAALESSGRD